MTRKNNLEEKLFFTNFLKRAKRFLGAGIFLGTLAYGALGCSDGAKVECKQDSECAATECDGSDGCVGNNYHDFEDVINSCVEGKCTENSCGDPTVYENDARCTDCQTDDDCDGLDDTHCDGTIVLHAEGRCKDGSCTADTSVVEDCDDGLYCNGTESCSGGSCVDGTVVDCTGSDVMEIAACDNVPDGNSSTWDSRVGFVSECVEKVGGYSCTTGDSTINHACDMIQCGASCEVDGDCAPTDCNGLDGCVGNDFHDYDNAANSCLDDCGCTDNACGDPTITQNDARCVPCQADDDCNALDNDYCLGDSVNHAEGKCINFSCQTEVSTVIDCSTQDDSYCDGSQIKHDAYTCFNASCVLDATTVVQDCDSLDADRCEGTEIKHDDYGCFDTSCFLDATTSVQDCDDGLYCNGNESCNNAACVSGTTVDCSGNDLPAINQCDYNPDGNSSTLDTAAGFTSTCDEGADSCTTGSYNFSHTCDTATCGASCESDGDCAATECDNLDGCVSGTFRDYHDATNSCLSSCSCTSNSCTDFTEIVTDNDLDGYDIECDGDCNDSDNGVWQNLNGYVDNDNDNWTVGGMVQVCSGDNLPNGYQSVSSATDDCNDGNPNVWQMLTGYVDNDNDGWTVGGAVQVCSGASLPLSYQSAASGTDDCDDNNNGVWQILSGYPDIDGDNYTLSNSEQVCSGNSLPSTHESSPSAQVDCDDGDVNVNPGASEDLNTSGQCEVADLDGVDNNCDGTVDEICMEEVITSPPVTFRMGCDNTVYSCDVDNTIHEVTLTQAYKIDKFEVTNEQYLECENAGACTAPSDNSSWTNPSYHDNPSFADFPVLYVDWNQAAQFCAWAGKELPTEAEWEYAARSDDEREFPWGNDAPDCTRLNYDMCTGDVEQVDSHPTGASPSGALNMSGNVMEWVKDWFAPYSGNPETDPQGPGTGTDKVVRGGVFFLPQDIEAYARGPPKTPDAAEPGAGFRCVKKE